MRKYYRQEVGYVFRIWISMHLFRCAVVRDSRIRPRKVLELEARSCHVLLPWPVGRSYQAHFLMEKRKIVEH